MLNFGKLKIVNFKLLSDTDNRKPLRESGAAYVLHFLFLAALPVVSFFGQPTFSENRGESLVLSCLCNTLIFSFFFFSAALLLLCFFFLDNQPFRFTKK